MTKGTGGVRNQPSGNSARSLLGLQNDPAYYDRTTERAYVFNSDGSLNLTISQHVETGVRIAPEVLETMSGKILIHNHPIPVLSSMPRSGLSQGDVYLTARYNLSEIRATNVRGTHVLTRGKGGWGDMSKVEDAMNTSRNVNSIHDGSWVRDFARMVGAHYVFIPR